MSQLRAQLFRLSPRIRRLRHRLAWTAGIACVVALVAGIAKVSEPAAFTRILEHLQPWWLALACVLQLATYVVQGEVWRVMARRSGTRLSIAGATRLSVVKLYIDQVQPSVGLSGAMTIAQALQRGGMADAGAIATAVVDTAAYYVAYLIALVAGVAVAAHTGHVTMLIVGAAIVVGAFALAAIRTILGIAAGRVPALWLLRRVGIVGKSVDVLRRADRTLVRDRDARARATACQLAIIVLDAGTMITLVHVMGADAPVAGVFASYMIASVFRTLGPFPGGLGSFEAASVLALHAIGVHTAVALSATLGFRALSFWLPMIPGFVASRQLAGTAGEGSP